MGYFSNGTEGMMYDEEYCSRCIHGQGKPCPVWGAHMLYNYRDCNDPESILHLLIPLSKGHLGNEQCRMFIEADAIGDLFDAGADVAAFAA